MKRTIDIDADDGEVSYGLPDEQSSDELPVGVVEWTPEREAFLRELRAALGTLDAKMVALFTGDAATLAARIDATPVTRLLGGES